MIAAALVVLAGIAVVSTGHGGELAPAASHRPGLELPAGRTLTAADLEHVRFSVGVWGYPPAQVEEVLDHVVRALAERDAHVADLERRLRARQLGEESGAVGGAPGEASGNGEEFW